MSNKRGGARAGTGPKPKLTPFQRLHLGAWVDRRLWRKTRAEWRRRDAATIAALSDGDLPRLWEEIWGPPIAQRHRVLIGRILHDARAEIEESLQGKRYAKGPTVIAAGLRVPIIRSVARAASRYWGKPITPRMVKTSLVAFRATNARTGAQLACDGIMALLKWLGVARPFE